MTLLPKSATIGGTINFGKYDNYRFEIGAEITTTEDYLGLVEFAASSLIGQFRQADAETQATVRAYVARLCSIEEAQVPCMQPPAPPPAKTSPSVTLDQVSPLPERMPAPTPAEQAAAAVRTCIKPAAPSPAPSAPPVAEASVPAGAPTAPQAAKPAPEGGKVCEKCGAPVPVSQAKISQLFMSKTLCKACMEAP